MTLDDSIEKGNGQAVPSEFNTQPDDILPGDGLARLQVALRGVTQMVQIGDTETGSQQSSSGFDDRAKRLEAALRLVSDNYSLLEQAAAESGDDDELAPGTKLDSSQTALVVANMGLASYIARRYTNKGEDSDDLEQVANHALIKAAVRFDPGQGFKFSTFATSTIKGELKRHFRDHTWSIGVPRRVNEIGLQIPKIREELGHKYMRSPTLAEIAAELGLDEDTVLDAMKACQGYRAASLDARLASDNITSNDSVRQEGNAYEDVDNKLLAERLLVCLDPREQLVLRAQAGLLPDHYGQQFTQIEVADMIGVSQMHVSRITTRALRKLSDIVAEVNMTYQDIC